MCNNEERRFTELIPGREKRREGSNFTGAREPHRSMFERAIPSDHGRQEKSIYENSVSTLLGELLWEEGKKERG